MLRLIAAAVALVLAAAAPLPDGPETAGYPAPAPTATATATATPAPAPRLRECVRFEDAPGSVETCVAWAAWQDDLPIPTPAVWPQAYP